MCLYWCAYIEWKRGVQALGIHNHVYIGNDAAGLLSDYIETSGYSMAVLVADATTFAVAGRSLSETLEERGITVYPVVLEGEEVIADERYLVTLFTRAPQTECVFVAVGSGTITDIVRFVSHRMKQPFLSYPTAASVDGFTSAGAPLIRNGVKRTIAGHAPAAMFADLSVLRNAPDELTAAGFADMLAKLASLADWRLGAEVWNESYDALIAERTYNAVRQCRMAERELADKRESGFRTLMQALAESGLCMLDYGESRPASGAEHHMSHFWEMQLLREGRPAILHGAKIGVATALSAQLYARVRSMSAEEARRALEITKLETHNEGVHADISTIRRVYGPLADEVIAGHQPFLAMSEEQHALLRERIVDKWEQIQNIAAEVPPAEEIRASIARLGGPASTSQLPLSRETVENGYRHGHFLRNRFTVVKLARMLGIHEQNAPGSE